MGVDITRGIGRLLMVLVTAYWLAAGAQIASAYWGAYRAEIETNRKALADFATGRQEDAARLADLNAYDKQQEAEQRAKDPTAPTRKEIVAAYEAQSGPPPVSIEQIRSSLGPKPIGLDALKAGAGAGVKKFWVWAGGFLALSVVGLALRWILRGFVPKATT